MAGDDRFVETAEQVDPVYLAIMAYAVCWKKVLVRSPLNAQWGFRDLGGKDLGLSAFNKRLFRPIIRSQIDDMHHVMLVHPNSAARAEEVKAAFINLNLSSEGRSILEEFRHSKGFAATEAEEVENMLDLLQTLED